MRGGSARAIGRLELSQHAYGFFHWNELLTNDPEAAVKFFEDVVGWSFENMDMRGPHAGGTYWIAMANGRPAGGILQMKGIVPEGVPPHWMSYLAVDNLDERIAAARNAGAAILREPFEVDGVGRIAMVQDPTGGVMGWITPAERQAAEM
mgnify:CR=1 FL=1